MPQLIKKWVFASDEEGWVAGGGTGSPAWDAGAGESDGGWEASCTSSGLGCNFQARGAVANGANGFRYDGTWTSIGIPKAGIITGFTAATTYCKVRHTSAEGTGQIRGSRIWDKDLASLWSIHGITTTTTSWVNYSPATDLTGLSIPATDTFRLNMGYRGTLPIDSFATNAVQLDEYQITVDYVVPTMFDKNVHILKAT